MNLIDAVIDQIQADFYDGDLTALEELLKDIPEEDLKAYLSEAGDE